MTEAALQVRRSERGRAVARFSLRTLAVSGLLYVLVLRVAFEHSAKYEERVAEAVGWGNVPVLPTLALAVTVLVGALAALACMRRTDAALMRAVIVLAVAGNLVLLAALRPGGPELALWLGLDVVAVLIAAFAGRSERAVRGVMLLCCAAAAYAWLVLQPCSVTTACVNTTARQVVLVQEGYEWYNILWESGVYYAIPQSDGPFNLARFRRGRYAAGVSGSDINEVRDRIVERAIPVPTLVEENYKGYNIVKYDRTYYAVPQSAGAFRPEAIDAFGYPGGVTGDTAARAAAAVEEALAARIEANYREFQIYRLPNRYVAVRRDRGLLLAQRLEAGEYPDAIVRPALEDVKAVINELPAREPVLVEAEYRGFNLVKFGTTYYAIPSDGGSFDIGRYEAGGYLQSAAHESLQRLKARVDELAAGAGRR